MLKQATKRIVFTFLIFFMSNTPSHNNQAPKTFSSSIPAAIVIGFALVAVAVYFKPGTSATAPPPSQADAGAPTPTAQRQGPQDNTAAAENIRPVSEADHILGDRSASVTLIEYSDLECPFCKRVHPTLQQILSDYDGQVRWVYRHFPLSGHRNAHAKAQAAECAAELSGNTGFFGFVDYLFADNGPSQTAPLAEADYAQIASRIGADAGQLQECAESGKYEEKVDADLADAAAAGGRGTPHTLIIGPSGEIFPVSGAQPYSAFASVVDQALQE